MTHKQTPRTRLDIVENLLTLLTHPCPQLIQNYICPVLTSLELQAVVSALTERLSQKNPHKVFLAICLIKEVLPPLLHRPCLLSDP